MSFFLNPHRFINPSGIFVVGPSDSNGDGRGTTTTTVPSGQLYYWNAAGSSWDMVTTGSVANDTGSVWGSIWQQFAIDFFAATGRPVYLINCASGGSNFSPDGDTNNWSPTGTRRAAMTTKVDTAITALNSLLGTNYSRSSIEGGFSILGVNDCRSIQGGGETLSNLQADVPLLYSWLATEFPAVQWMCGMPGTAETPTYDHNNAAFYGVRAAILANIRTTSNVRLAVNAMQFIDATTLGSDSYGADHLHYSQGMNNILGSMFARNHFSTITNKNARFAYSALFSDYNSAWASEIMASIVSLETAGQLNHIIGGWFLYQSASGDERNCLVDLMGITGNTLFNGPTIGASKKLSMNGTSHFAQVNYVNAGYNAFGAGQNNFRAIVGVGSVSTASGVSGSLLGAGDVGGDLIRFGQGIAPSFLYSANRTTNVTYSGGATVVTPNMEHAVGRDGTTQTYYRNGVSAQSAVLASTGTCDRMPITAAFLNIGTPAQWLACDLEYQAYVVEVSNVGSVAFDGPTFRTLNQAILDVL